ncbi:hypothetical protein CKM354_000432300 [Cercospora kikuchii]|uniref:Uncharacterized protein n=1 Tax=Cercospora kikuchii TaxID=84275 RepID=A0A9P3CJN2_9PEZI|nr:uncharacterized protein CKM354_000432300 [Cercospora kikuchii]GIZ41005.1 hypothetical protein CKM354_000432300 [Cercospora kikuchii]
MAQSLTQTMMKQPEAIPESPGLAECVVEATQPASRSITILRDDNNLPPKAMILYDKLGNVSKAGDLTAVKVTLAKSGAELGENMHCRLENPL